MKVLIIVMSLFLFSGCAVLGEKLGLASLDSLERVEQEMDLRLGDLEKRIHLLEPKVISQGEEVTQDIVISKGKIIINE